MHTRTHVFAILLSCAVGSAVAITAADYPIPPCEAATQAQGNACAFLPREPQFGHSERAYRQAAGEPDWSAIHQKGGLGLALSGGGSKAAAFSMGVLSGLSDLDLLTGAAGNGRVEIITSVSGGGYTAFWLMSQLVRRTEGTSKAKWNDATGIEFYSMLFEDCLTQAGSDPNHYFKPELRDALEEIRCDPYTYYGKPSDLLNLKKSDSYAPKNPFQFVLRCGQDILEPGECSNLSTGLDKFSSGLAVGQLLIPSLALALPHHVANSLFDWGWNAAPSRAAYRDGMGLTYGVTPALGFRVKRQDRGRIDFACLARTQPPEKELPTDPDPLGGNREDAELLGCYRDPTSDRPKPEGLSFERLRLAWEKGREAKALHVPFWVVQATAPEYRGLAGMLLMQHRIIPDDTFEFTPLGFGSRRYGFVKGSLEGIDALEATTAAAAFLDSAQSSLGTFAIRPVLNAAQHTFNASWGLDIPNYSVGNARRVAHKILPFPLNTIDSLLSRASASNDEHVERVRSAWIRLMDGGNADDTALFGLLRRGVRVAVVADSAHDAMVFDDMCVLHNQLRAHRVATPHESEGSFHYLRIPALQDFEAHCAHYDRGVSGYSFWGHWPGNSSALLGCITRRENADCSGSTDVAMKLIIIKPHLSLSAAASVTFEGKTVKQCQYANRLYGGISSKEHCSKVPSVCRATLPCEVAYRYLRDEGVPTAAKAEFPQNSTVFTTANSSGTVFAAYRDLARAITFDSGAAITAALSLNEAEWRSMLSSQESDFIPLCQLASANRSDELRLKAECRVPQ